MFKNLTSRQKIMLVVLGIVVLACLILALYFALSKKSPPPKSANTISFARFSSKANPEANPPLLLPWKIATYYKYSYMDGITEGDLSEIYPEGDNPLIKSDTETYPVLDFPVNDIKTDNYTIKVYRAVDDGSGNVPDPSKFTVLNPQPVIDYVNGNFTDTQNPFTVPTPLLAPTFEGFTDKPPAGGFPWKLATYYTYSYVDLSNPKYPVEGSQSPPTTAPPAQTIVSDTQTSPKIGIIILTFNYGINIYRAVDDGSKTPTFNYFDTITPYDKTPLNYYIDTQNPYKPPPIPPALHFAKFSAKGNPPLIPWKIETFYRYSYINGITEGDLSNINPSVGESPIKSNTETNPVLYFDMDNIIKYGYKIKVYRAVDDGSGKVPDPSKFTALTPQPVIDYVNGNFTDIQNPYTGPIVPQGPMFLVKFTQLPNPKGTPPTYIWGTQTYYKYSYVDVYDPANPIEGPITPFYSPQDEDMPVVSNTQTNPLINFPSKSPFHINVYRGTNKTDKFSLLTNIQVNYRDNNSYFIDLDNPYNPYKPPKPSSITFIEFLENPANPPTSYPWYYKTFYKYAYVDKSVTPNVTGDFSDPYPSTPSVPNQVQSNNESYPTLKVTLNNKYSIVIQRSVNDTSNFTLLNTPIAPTGDFIDSQNPYKPPN